jgi:hypothetical protein
VTTFIKENIHLKQLNRCIQSICNFHSSYKIFILNDSEKDLDFSENKNIYVFKNLYKGSGELFIFKFILENDLIEENDNIIYIHDSCVLKKKIENIDKIKDVQFLWHFTNHRIHWDIIIEEKNEYNLKNNIITHTDLVKHYILKYYNNNNDFQNFAIDYLNNKSKWCGCMGFMCILKKKILIEFNNKTNFVEKFLFFEENICTQKRHRIVNESIFSILCHFFIQDKNFENSYDGLYYDGINPNKYAGINSGLENLVLVGGGNYIDKISFSR